eukprot:GDKJ01022004.1.p1 GENE.GDKJ01022004.1~~GDKJ01022004.1.p1  ORF type:complete len:613 (-),score=160.07 GDKJ01022004.1:1791-3629(-)
MGNMGSHQSKEQNMKPVSQDHQFTHQTSPSRHTPSVRQYPPSESDLIRANANSLAINARIIHCDINEKYEFVDKVLGTGFSGPVRMAVDKLSGRKVAVKPFSKVGARKDRIEMLKNEAAIYLKLDHPNICRLLEVVEDEECVYLIMECCTGRELYHRLCAKKTYSERHAAHTTRQMLHAISYLHAHDIVHRDLKLENWLYADESDEADLKLIDFGFSKIWNPLKSRRMHATCGSVAYVSPDTLTGSYTNACDMWSLGVLVYMLLVGYAPFWGSDEEVIKKISKGDYSLEGYRWESVSPLAKDFVSKLLVVDPQNRLTAQQALEHPWLNIASPEDNSSLSDYNLSSEVLSSLRSFAQSSHFRRAALTMVAFSLSSTELVDLQTTFKAMDHNHSGTLRISDLANFLKQHLDVSSDEIERIFQSLDHDGDHEISYTEFLAAAMQTRVRLHEDVLRKVFDRIDTTGSGFISVDDMRAIVGDYFEGEPVEELIRQVDRNGTGIINFEQFLSAVQGGGGSIADHGMDARSGDASSFHHPLISSSNPQKLNQLQTRGIMANHKAAIAARIVDEHLKREGPTKRIEVAGGANVAQKRDTFKAAHAQSLEILNARAAQQQH